jgi:hypothetical protein
VPLAENYQALSDKMLKSCNSRLFIRLAFNRAGIKMNTGNLGPLGQIIQYNLLKLIFFECKFSDGICHSWS